MKRSSRESGRHVDRSVLLVLLLLLLAASLLVAMAPGFRVQRFETTGTLSLDGTVLEHDSGLETGRHVLAGIGGDLDSFLGLRYGREERMLLEMHPYLRSVRIRFRFPGTVLIQAEERVEIAYLAVPDATVLIDAERYALDFREGSPPSGIPLIEGISIERLLLGSPIEVDHPRALSDSILLLSAILDADNDTHGELNLLSTVKTIRPAADDLLYMIVHLPETTEELIVRVSDPRTAQEDMKWLRYAIMQGDLKGLGSGILDLSGTQNRFVPDGK